MRTRVILPVVLFLLAVGGYWFWSLGTLPVDSEPAVTLLVERGQVEVRRSGGTDWQAAASGRVLQEGDVVRTGEDGRATVVFFDLTATRLSGGSELTIAEATSSQESVPSLRLRLELSRGRAWLRVQRLLDVKSSMSIQAPQAVATVRGTAFDFRAGVSGTAVMVRDGVVQADHVGGVSAPSVFIPEETKQRFPLEKATSSTTEPVSFADVQDEWVKHNEDQDASFVTQAKEMTAQQYAGKRSGTGAGFMADMVRASERLHVAFAGSRSVSLQARYVGRRLYEMRRLIEEGRSGLALQALIALEQDIQAQLAQPDGGNMRPYVQRAVADVLSTMSDVLPASSQYRFKQRLENMATTIAAPDAAATLYARLLSVDNRCEEARALLLASALEEAGQALDVAAEGLKNSEVDFHATGTIFSPEDAKVLEKKIAAGRARWQALQDRLTHALSTPLPGDGGASSTTSTVPLPGTATTTSPTSTTTPPLLPPTATTSSVAYISRIAVTVQPNPVMVGNHAVLKVTGYRTDGTTVDVTRRATFVLLGSLGALNGSIYEATQPGSTTIQANVSDHGTLLHATVSIRINEVTQVQSLALSAASTSVSAGSRMAVIAKVAYTNGLTQDVTPQVVWTTSNPAIGTMNGNIFVAGSQTGSVTVTGQYSQAGVSRSATLVFTVAAGTATQMIR